LAWRSSRRSSASIEAKSRPPSATRCPALVVRADLKGDLHLHTTTTDGRNDIETMALAAKAAGLEYIAITDHSKALAMASGLDEAAALEHAAHIRQVGARLDGITLLAGIECDILTDGTMDLADDCLAQLDFVVASVHTAFGLEPAAMTDGCCVRWNVRGWMRWGTRRAGCCSGGSRCASTSKPC
jgi:hypothetical protein